MSSRDSSNSEQRFFLRPVPKYADDGSEALSQVDGDSATNVPTDRIREIMADYVASSNLSNEDPTMVEELAGFDSAVCADEINGISIADIDGIGEEWIPYPSSLGAQLNMDEMPLLNQLMKFKVAQPEMPEHNATDFKPFFSRNYLAPEFAALINWERPIVSAGALLVILGVLGAFHLTSFDAVFNVGGYLFAVALICMRLIGIEYRPNTVLFKRLESQVLAVLNDFEWFNNRIICAFEVGEYNFVAYLILGSLVGLFVGHYVDTITFFFIGTLTAFFYKPMISAVATKPSPTAPIGISDS